MDLASIAEFIKALLPPAMIADTAQYLIDICKLTAALLVGTQAAKIGARLLHRGRPASHGFIYVVTLVLSCGLAWLTFDGDMADKFSAALVSGGLATFLARYGLAILKARFPTVWAAVQSERRRQHLPSPDGKDKRNDDL